MLENCDAVIVASVNRDHHRLVLAAASAGRHVLCEKPLATDLASAEEMIARCRSAGA